MIERGQVGIHRATEIAVHPVLQVAQGAGIRGRIAFAAQLVPLHILAEPEFPPRTCQRGFGHRIAADHDRPAGRRHAIRAGHGRRANGPGYLLPGGFGLMAGEGEGENDQADDNNGHDGGKGLLGWRRRWLQHGRNDARAGGRQHGIQRLPLPHAFAPHQFGTGQFAPIPLRLQLGHGEDAQILSVMMQVIVHGERAGRAELLAHAQFLCRAVQMNQPRQQMRMGGIERTVFYKEFATMTGPLRRRLGDVHLGRQLRAHGGIHQ